MRGLWASAGCEAQPRTKVTEFTDRGTGGEEVSPAGLTAAGLEDVWVVLCGAPRPVPRAGRPSPSPSPVASDMVSSLEWA